MQRLLSVFIWVVIGSSVFREQRVDAMTIGAGQESQLTNALHNGINVFELTGQITLSKPLVIVTNVVMQGVNSNLAILSGNYTHRLFVILPGGSLTLSNLTLINGRQTSTNSENGGIVQAAGGAVYNDRGTLRINSCVISSHAVVGATGAAGLGGSGPNPGQIGGNALGGAIYNYQGTVVLNASTVMANTVFAGAGGSGADGSEAGLGQNGANGGASGLGAGGAIYSWGGSLEIVNCIVASNSVSGAPGGKQGAGGGLLGFSAQPGAVNAAAGGGVYGEGNMNLSITASQFIGNTVTNAPGWTGAVVKSEKPGAAGSTGGSSFGGAIYSNARLTLAGTTFLNNWVGGGLGGSGSPAGSSLFSLTGGDGGSGGTAIGGAVFSGEAGVAMAQNCYFNNNTALGGPGGAGGAGNNPRAKNGRSGTSGLGAGSALANPAGTFTLGNLNSGDVMISTNVYGTFKNLPSQGFNYSLDGGSLTLRASTVFVGAEVQVTTNLSAANTQWTTLAGRVVLVNTSAVYNVLLPSTTNVTHIYRLKY